MSPFQVGFFCVFVCPGPFRLQHAFIYHSSPHRVQKLVWQKFAAFNKFLLLPLAKYLWRNVTPSIMYIIWMCMYLNERHLAFDIDPWRNVWTIIKIYAHHSFTKTCHNGSNWAIGRFLWARNKRYGFKYNFSAHSEKHKRFKKWTNLIVSISCRNGSL